MYACKMYEILNRIFTIIVYALHYLSTISVKFMIMPLVLLIDPGVVSEVEHNEPPSQKMKLDYGKLSDFHYAVKCSNFSPYTCKSEVDCQLYKYGQFFDNSIKTFNLHEDSLIKEIAYEYLLFWRVVVF